MLLLGSDTALYGCLGRLVGRSRGRVLVFVWWLPALLLELVCWPYFLFEERKKIGAYDTALFSLTDIFLFLSLFLSLSLYFTFPSLPSRLSITYSLILLDYSVAGLSFVERIELWYQYCMCRIKIGSYKLRLQYLYWWNKRRLIAFLMATFSTLTDVGSRTKNKTRRKPACIMHDWIWVCK